MYVVVFACTTQKKRKRKICKHSVKIKRASGGDRKTTEQHNGTTLSHNSSKEKNKHQNALKIFHAHTHAEFYRTPKVLHHKWIGGGHMSFNSYNKRNQKKTAAKGFLLFKSAFVHIYMYLYMFFLAFLLSTHTHCFVICFSCSSLRRKVYSLFC